MKKISCAMLFNKIVLENKIVFLPMRLCIGEYMPKENMFYDYLSNFIFPNINDCLCLELDVAFGNVRNISSIINSVNLKESLIRFVANSKKQIIIASFNLAEKKFEFEEYNTDDLSEDDDFFIRYLNIEEQISALKTEREMLDVIVVRLSEIFAESSADSELKENADNKPIKISELYEGIKSEVISQDAQIRRWRCRRCFI